MAHEHYKDTYPDSVDKVLPSLLVRRFSIRGIRKEQRAVDEVQCLPYF